MRSDGMQRPSPHEFRHRVLPASLQWPTLRPTAKTIRPLVGSDLFSTRHRSRTARRTRKSNFVQAPVKAAKPMKMTDMPLYQDTVEPAPTAPTAPARKKKVDKNECRQGIIRFTKFRAMTPSSKMAAEKREEDLVELTSCASWILPVDGQLYKEEDARTMKAALAAAAAACSRPTTSLVREKDSGTTLVTIDRTPTSEGGSRGGGTLSLWLPTPGFCLLEMREPRICLWDRSMKRSGYSHGNLHSTFFALSLSSLAFLLLFF